MKINIKGAVIYNDYKWIYDLFESDSVCPKDVERALIEANGADVEVIINSGGGYVDAGVEIYSLLKDYQGKVTVKIVGMAASIASVIAMAGDIIKISPPAQIMIHNASTVASGDYRAMDKASEVLRKTNESIISAYVLKTGMCEKDLRKLMDSETYMTSQEALKYGFVDEIMFDDRQKFVASEGIGSIIPENVINKLRNLLIDSKSGEGDLMGKIKDLVSDSVNSVEDSNTEIEGISTIEDSVVDSGDFTEISSEGDFMDSVDVVEDSTGDTVENSTEDSEDASDAEEDTGSEESTEDSTSNISNQVDGIKSSLVEESTNFDNGTGVEGRIADVANIPSTDSLEDLKKQLTEKDVIIAQLKAENEDLKKNSEAAEAYRKDLIDRALTLGVRAQGNTFQMDLFNKFLSSLSLEEIKNIIAEFENSVNSKFSNCKVTNSEDRSLKSRVEDVVPDKENENEFREFVANKAREYAMQNSVSISEATKLMYEKYSKEN